MGKTNSLTGLSTACPWTRECHDAQGRPPPPTAGEGSTNRTNEHADIGAKTTINILVVKYDTVLITHRL